MANDRYERKVFYSRRDRCWISVAPELPGCSAFGDTPAAALRELDIAMGLWIDVAREENHLPMPLANRELSGRVLLRLPRELHEEYAALAAAEGVSLNQYMLYVLARYRELGQLARYARFEGEAKELQGAHKYWTPHSEVADKPKRRYFSRRARAKSR